MHSADDGLRLGPIARILFTKHTQDDPLLIIRDTGVTEDEPC